MVSISSYFVRLFVAVLFACPFYIMIRKPFRRHERRELFLAAFWLYHVALFTLVFKGWYHSPAVMFEYGKIRLETMFDINLVPFRTIRNYLRIPFTENVAINIFGNIVMFIPWGFGLTMLWKNNRKISSLIPMLLGLTVSIEICQLFIGRFVDVDDIILNFVGGCIGTLISFAVRKRWPEAEKMAR